MKTFVKETKEWLELIVILWPLWFVLGFVALGIWLDYQRYETYIQITHNHLSFFQYNLLKSHLRVGQ